MPMESAINLACSLTPTRPLEHLRARQTEHVTMFEAIEAQYKDAARVTCAPMSSACKRIFDGPNGGTSRTDGALVGKILIPEIVANVTFGAPSSTACSFAERRASIRFTLRERFQVRLTDFSDS
jgi:hypothetical protein